MSEFVERANQQWRDTYPPGEPGVAEWRVAVTELHAKFPLPADAVVEEVDAGGVPALWVSAPGAGTGRVAVHFHSGGYVMGSAHNYREFAYRLSAAIDARVLVVDYRLAPEHVYPAAVEDALAAYRWLAGTVDPSRIVVTGDSAGGGLALGLTLALRDAGESLPAAVIGFSPLTDLLAEGDSYDLFPDDLVVSRPFALANAVVYLGEGVDPKQNPYGSPLYGEFAGFPPVLLIASGHECLRDDSVRVVEKAAAAGVDAQLHLVPLVPHVFQIFPFLPESGEALEVAAGFLKDRV